MIKPIILCSDCLEGLLQMDENTADLCLIDPPYFNYKTEHRKDKADKLSQSIVQQPRDEQIEVIRQCIRILKPDRAFFVFTNWENIWWMSQPFLSLWRNMIIWDKGNWTAGDLKGSFGNQYEIILLGSKGKWEFKGKRESDIWRIARVGTNRIHPTEKPVELYLKIIESSTNKGDLVIDPYVGSGSSAEAALQLGRNFLGYEIDRTFWERATKRLDSIYKGGIK